LIRRIEFNTPHSFLNRHRYSFRGYKTRARYWGKGCNHVAHDTSLAGILIQLILQAPSSLLKQALFFVSLFLFFLFAKGIKATTLSLLI
jgi:hypothetical protein